MEACLPASLRDQPIVRVRAGLSGAGVYKVGDAHILKVDPEGDFAQKVAIVRAAAEAGVAPEVVHVDAAHRAIVSKFVEDRGLMPILITDRPKALQLLGEALQRIQSIPLTSPTADPRGFFARTLASTQMPQPLRTIADAVLALEPPPTEYAFAHCDANPTNFVFDGERVMFLDWDMAAVNSTTYDAATLALFLRLPAFGEPTPRFRYDRKLVAAMCGTIFLHLAGGHAGASEPESLNDVYAAMRGGSLDVATPEGKWRMGLALLAQAT